MSSLLYNFYDPFSFSAVWISLPEAVRPNFCMQGTRGFQYEPGPEKAILRIAAESYYRLFINGFFVGNGPVRGTCSVNYFDAYDISGLLRKGDNRIGVVVQSMNSTQSFNSHPAGCAFIAELPGVLATGTDWKMRPTPGWIHTERNFTLQHGYKIEYDLRKEDRGWLDGTGTGTWADAIVFHNAALNAKRLSPRGIPPLRETDFTPELLIAAETVPEDVPEGEDIGDVLNREVWHDNTDRVVRSGEDQYTLLPGEGGAVLIFDFGQECTGYLEVEIEAAAGTRLDITYGEDLWHGRVRASFRATGYKEMYFFTDTYYLRDGLNSVGNYFLEHGASLVQLSFRNMTGPVHIRKIVYHDCRFPYRAAARFHCSDPVLDRIWDICRETLELCTTDVFEDCPWREHAFWVNDLVVENLTSLTLFGAAAVHRRAFDLAFSQQYPSGWCPGVAPTARNESKPSNILPATNFFLFKILEDYYRESGDLATVKRYLDNLKRILDAAERETDTDGLIRPPLHSWNFFDWGFELNWISVDHRKESMLNSLYISAMKSYMNLCRAAGIPCGEAVFQPRIDRIASALRGFLSPETGLLEDPASRIDCVTGEKAPYKLRSELSHALALRSGVWPEADRKNFLRALLDRRLLMPEFYLSGFVFRELTRAGHAEEALRRIRKYWGNVVDRGCRTMPESGIYKFGREAFREAGSLCHGFATCPVFFFRNNLLGVRALEPGYAKFEFAPEPLDLEFVSGEVHTPHGFIVAEWRKNGGILHTKLRVPSGCAAVLMDGRVFRAGEHEFEMERKMGDGKHE